MSLETAIPASGPGPAMLGCLFLAAALGGALNSVAGGGSFISFPALLFAGVSPVSANATNTVALWPGNLASAIGYRRELSGPRPLLMTLTVSSLLGGAAGALLLLHTKESSFVSLIPWLLLVATLLFTAGPALSARFPPKSNAGGSLGGVAAAQFAIAVYGGYFGAGMGILILATLGLVGMVNIHAMNGLKSILATLINGVAVVLFMSAGAIAWRPGAVMVVGGMLGGYSGAWLARRLDPRRVRRFAAVVAWAMTGWFFIQPHLGHASKP